MDIIPLTAEQQAVVDASFNKRFAELNAKAEAKTNEAMALAEARYKEQTAKLEMELSEMKKGNGKGKIDDSAVVARLAAFEQKWKQSNERAARGELKSIAAELNAINAEQVAALIGGYIRYDDDGNPTVVNAEGKPRVNAENKAMVIKELVSEFLSANPHFVKAGGTAGAGSAAAKGGDGSGSGRKISRAEFDALSVMEKRDFALKSGNQIVN